MNKKEILWISAGFVLLAVLAISARWFLNNRDQDWTFEDTETKCLIQPSAVVPSPMPQRKQYTIDSFAAFSYQFPSWWNIQSYLVGEDVFEKLAISNDGKNAWFTSFTLDGSLARYDIQTTWVKQYQIFNDKNELFHTYDLYVARNGTLWVVLGRDYPALARYLPDNDSFEVIADKDGLFKQLVGDQGIPYSSNYLGELSDGQLAVVLDGKIYLYDPVKNQARLLFDDFEVETIAVDSADHIWVEKYVMFPDEGGFNLIMLDPKTGKVSDYGLPPQMAENVKEQPLNSATKAITVDREGRVWVSYFDRLEPDANGKYSWHSLDLPPVFVTTRDPGYSYRWADAFSVHEFSDGNLWFASEVGIVKYDVKKETWCLSAVIKTSDYPIAEDVKGNVWTIVDDHIYKLQP